MQVWSVSIIKRNTWVNNSPWQNWCWVYPSFSEAHWRKHFDTETVSGDVAFHRLQKQMQQYDAKLTTTTPNWPTSETSEKLLSLNSYLNNIFYMKYFLYLNFINSGISSFSERVFSGKLWAPFLSRHLNITLYNISSLIYSRLGCAVNVWVRHQNRVRYRRCLSGGLETSHLTDQPTCFGKYLNL